MKRVETVTLFGGSTTGACAFVATGTRSVQYDLHGENDCYTVLSGPASRLAYDIG